MFSQWKIETNEDRYARLIDVMLNTSNGGYNTTCDGVPNKYRFNYQELYESAFKRDTHYMSQEDAKALGAFLASKEITCKIESATMAGNGPYDGSVGKVHTIEVSMDKNAFIEKVNAIFTAQPAAKKEGGCKIM